MGASCDVRLLKQHANSKFNFFINPHCDLVSSIGGGCSPATDLHPSQRSRFRDSAAENGRASIVSAIYWYSVFAKGSLNNVFKWMFNSENRQTLMFFRSARQRPFTVNNRSRRSPLPVCRRLDCRLRSAVLQVHCLAAYIRRSRRERPVHHATDILDTWLEC